MTGDERDRRDLEDVLRRGLEDLAPEPGDDLGARVAAAIEATPQGPARGRPPGARTPARRWSWLGAALGAAAIVGGVAVGLSAARLVGADPSPSMTATTPTASASPAASVTPAATPQPSATPETAEPLDPDVAWERIELPDPVTGTHEALELADAVSFSGGHVIVGTVQAYCGADVDGAQPAPEGCEERVADLVEEGRYQAAVVWLSVDGRRWEAITSPAFDRGIMTDIATDGTRLLAAGQVLPAPVVFGVVEGVPTIWESSDGRSWEIAASGAVPELVASSTSGWVGVRNTDGGPEFLASTDGRAWSVVAGAGALGLGTVEDLVAGADGRVVAVGQELRLTDDLQQIESSVMAVWLTGDGRSWERAPEQPSMAVEGCCGIFLGAAAASGDGWLAAGRDDDRPEGVAGAWRSGDGRTWDRLPGSGLPASPDASDILAVIDLAATAPGFLLAAQGSAEGASLWVSPDGSTWERTGTADGLENGLVSALTANRDLAIAAGVVADGANRIPVVHVAAR